MSKLKRRKCRLTNVEVNELSIVDSGANRRDFLLFKRNGGKDMKIEKDKNLSILEQASESLDAMVEKYSKEETIDTLVLAKEVAKSIVPVVDFCTNSIVEKMIPENLANNKKVEYTNFVKWNSLTAEPLDVVKVWTDWMGGATVTYPWFPPTPPPAIKKREEMTEEELVKDFGEVIEVIKSGKKISKNNIELVKNTVGILADILKELDPPKVEDKDPMEKEFEALSEDQKKEVMKSLEELKAKVDALKKK